MDAKNRMQMARERAGFENEAAAAAVIGCSRTLVIAWENDEADVRKSRYVYPVAVAYKVRPEWVRNPAEPDGFPWTPGGSKTVAQVITDGSPERPEGLPAPNHIDEIRLAVTAIARVLAATKLDVAAALAGELEAIPDGRFLDALLGVVQREHAKLKDQAPKSPDRKAQGSKKHSRA